MAFECRALAPLIVATLTVLLANGQGVLGQGGSFCGGLGQSCCCREGDWQNRRCCQQGLQCTRFSGQGFGIVPSFRSLCISNEPKKQQQGCGFQDGPCCLSSSFGTATAFCSSGLSCIPSSIGWASRSQYIKLGTGFTAALKDPAVMGTCKKFTAAQCGKAYMPCGKDIAASGVECPGSPITCPSGFYCAADFDAGVGERCLPIPSNAGQPGGPCLPNNLQEAPIVKFSGKDLAPAFCRGAAVCFAGITGNTSGFTHNQPQRAKTLASRISGTKCVMVPKDCGSAPGKPCCPSGYGVVTDKPLPSLGKKWAKGPCDNDKAKYGVYCEGNYVALASDPLGICTANTECGAETQPCCKYSGPSTSGYVCPAISPLGSGAGYCTNYNKCRTCPTPLVTIEDIFRCF